MVKGEMAHTPLVVANGYQKRGSEGPSTPSGKGTVGAN